MSSDHLFCVSIKYSRGPLGGIFLYPPGGLLLYTMDVEYSTAFGLDKCFSTCGDMGHGLASLVAL